MHCIVLNPAPRGPPGPGLILPPAGDPAPGGISGEIRHPEGCPQPQKQTPSCPASPPNWHNLTDPAELTLRLHNFKNMGLTLCPHNLIHLLEFTLYPHNLENQVGLTSCPHNLIGPGELPLYPFPRWGN